MGKSTISMAIFNSYFDITRPGTNHVRSEASLEMAFQRSIFFGKPVFAREGLRLKRYPGNTFGETASYFQVVNLSQTFHFHFRNNAYRELSFGHLQLL